MQLWAVSPNTSNGNNQLCLIGFDEWGKQNNMCFEVTLDWHYEQAPLPVPAVETSGGTIVKPPASTDCAVDLAANGFNSVDGIHHAEGFDIWTTTSTGSIDVFLYWTGTRPSGMGDCNLFI